MACKCKNKKEPKLHHNDGCDEEMCWIDDEGTEFHRGSCNGVYVRTQKKEVLIDKSDLEQHEFETEEELD